jgi:predicted patatin/cPLA2 family phospholipase
MQPIDSNKNIVDIKKNTALIVEGGGLRGAYAVGVLKKLYEYGGPHQFKAIYAVSSGVFAATFFLAEQVEYMENTWRNLVHGSQLIKFTNFFRRKPILRLDYLIDLFKGPVLLDLDKVFNSNQSLTYVLTDYKTGLPSYVDAKKEHIFDMMKASSALPFVYHRPVYINNRRYFDGGHSDGIPIQKVIKSGYDEIVVVLTRPIEYRKKPASNIVANMCFKKAPKAKEAFLNFHNAYNNSLNLIDNPPSNIKIIAIRPNGLQISRLTRDQDIIIKTIEQGKEDAEIIFSAIVNKQPMRNFSK